MNKYHQILERKDTPFLLLSIFGAFCPLFSGLVWTNGKKCAILRKIPYCNEMIEAQLSKVAPVYEVSQTVAGVKGAAAEGEQANTHLGIRRRSV